MSFYLLPLVIGAVLLGAAFAMRLSAARRRGELEVAAGLEVLRTLRWKEFAQYVTQSFEARGYRAETGQRRPGEDGVDIVLTRSGERLLLQVKHGGSYLVGGGPVRTLAGMLAAHGANAGVIATSGAFDAAALDAARERQVTLLAGEPLWNGLRGLLPDSLVAEVDERAGETAGRAQSKLNVLAIAGAAMAVLGAGLWGLAAMEARDEPVDAPIATTPAAAADVPGASAGAAATAAPPAEPSAAELAQQRDFAAAETLLVNSVASAAWSSSSTLEVTLRGPLEDARRAEILRDVCARVTARDALRFTRLQVETIGLAAGDPAAATRWYPCR